jgi:WD40 repeat protein/serine/threonine protein kinase
MSTSTGLTGICSRCGKALSNALAGHCPSCLLEISLGLGADKAPNLAPGEQLPGDFGEYQIISEIARGGMGVVYRARQNKLKRIVALKLVLAGHFASRADVDRFRAEAQAAAALKHPNIITVYDVGETDGQAFFTMELIEGSTLTDLVSSGPLPPERAAKYVETIARAVSYAHESGVLHRDLKPSNILIDALDEPRITDFGLAKQLFANSYLTVTGQCLGSPGYMAPEQSSTRYGEVSVASDVYSLGALLYHLITGRAPFATGTVAETLEQALNNEPLPPRALNPNVPVDLQTICLKCLQKEPKRRYQIAEALADELGRYLRDEPIEARPAGRIENAWRWCRRKPVVAALSATVVSLFLVLTAGALFAVWRIEKARRALDHEHDKTLRANIELQRANSRLADTVSVLELRRAEGLFRSGDSSMALAQLAVLLRRDPSNHIAAARIISALTYRNWVLPGSDPLPHPGFVSCLGSSRSGRYLVTGCADGFVRVWDARDHRQIGQSLEHASPVRDVAFAPDETTIATGAEDGNLRIWNWRAGHLTLSPIKHPGWVFSVSFSPDGQRVVTACDDSLVRIWAADSGQLLLTLSGHMWAVRKAVFSPDGNVIASGGYDTTARLWDSHTGKPLGSPFRHDDGPVFGIAFSPAGNWVGTASRDRTARIWSVETGVQVIPALPHPGGLNDVAFDPTGRLLVTCSFDNTVRLWGSESGRLVSQPFRHSEQVNAAVFLWDGETLATASDDRLLKFWNVRPGQALRESMRHQNNLNEIEGNSAGDLIVTASKDETARVWNAHSAVPVTGPLPHSGPVQSACFSPDGRYVVTASAETSAIVWEARTGDRLERHFPHGSNVCSVAFSPNGKRLVTGSADHSARVWDFESASPLTPPMRHRGEVISACFSPDSARVLTASSDGTARVWDARSGEPITASLAHGDELHCAVFSPDGQRVATASADNTARVWDARTGQPLGRVLNHLRSVRTVAFSPDGSRVVTASLDRTARVWDAFTGGPLTPAIEHDEAVYCAMFSPDGTQILTGSEDHTARIWDAKTGLPLSEPFWHRGPVLVARFSADGRSFFTAGTWPDNAAHTWFNPVGPPCAPEWLPELAEAVAGVSFTDQGTTRLISDQEFSAIKERVNGLKGEDDFSQAARWFFADRATRTVSPFDAETVPEYVQRRIQENTRASLEEAIHLEPTNSLALARLAHLIRNTDSSEQAAADAAILARLAERGSVRSVERGEEDRGSVKR